MEEEIEELYVEGVATHGGPESMRRRLGGWAVYPVTADALYIHEKQIIIDGSTALIGSQNASSASLNRNRELSIQITAAQIVRVATSTAIVNSGQRPADPISGTGGGGRSVCIGEEEEPG